MPETTPVNFCGPLKPGRIPTILAIQPNLNVLATATQRGVARFEEVGNRCFSRDKTIHLLFPFAASIVFTVGGLFLKRCGSAGINPWSTIFVTNIFAAIVFSFFWPMGGTIPSVFALWQPAFIALLYCMGQCFILCAFSYGDISVAAPVASTKVLFVAAMLPILTSSPPPMVIWLAAVLAVMGILLINLVARKGDRKVVFRTIGLALAAGFSFASFDLAIQELGTPWGTGRIGPITYWFVGLYSLALLPFVDRWEIVTRKGVHPSLLIGSFLVALQATFLVYALSNFNDAAGINVVYSLRGLWGVLFAWALADWAGGSEATQTRLVMVLRLVGSSMLVLAVIMTILSRYAAS